MKHLLLPVAFLLLSPVPTTAGEIPSEVECARLIGKQRHWRVEVPMPDSTRCDLISETYAMEVEWASKWKEAPAQATLYAIWTGKKPAVILLVKSSDEKLDVLRCKMVCERLQIAMEVLDVRTLENGVSDEEESRTGNQSD